MKKIAKFWKAGGEKVKCFLCNWRCSIALGKSGVCNVRKNEGGELQTLVYGTIASMAVDPIEKKPFYHFWPGSQSFSIAAPGCNFFCAQCQNWTLSRAKLGGIPTEDVAPEKLVEMAKNYGCQGISHTYTEPTLWTEYAMDVGKLAHKEGIYNTYVSNGYITIEALEEFAPHLDGANVDVKAFTDRFYQKICGVKSLQPVLDTCEWMVKHGIHLEITYLIIPRENDSADEIGSFCKWVMEDLGPDIPVHFSRFFPHYKMVDREPTEIATLDMAHHVAKEAGIRYVYVGNVPAHDSDNTYCHGCGAKVIERFGFDVTQFKLKDGKCPKCGAEIKVTGKYVPSSGR